MTVAQEYPHARHGSRTERRQPDSGSESARPAASPGWTSFPWVAWRSASLHRNKHATHDAAYRSGGANSISRGRVGPQGSGARIPSPVNGLALGPFEMHWQAINAEQVPELTRCDSHALQATDLSPSLETVFPRLRRQAPSSGAESGFRGSAGAHRSSDKRP